MSAPGPVRPQNWKPRPRIDRVSFVLGVVVAIGAMFIYIGAARAEQETGVRYVLIECAPGMNCRPRGKPLYTLTACELDSVSLANVAVKATKIHCKRIGK